MATLRSHCGCCSVAWEPPDNLLTLIVGFSPRHSIFCNPTFIRHRYRPEVVDESSNKRRIRNGGIPICPRVMPLRTGRIGRHGGGAARRRSGFAGRRAIGRLEGWFVRRFVGFDGDVGKRSARELAGRAWVGDYVRKREHVFGVARPWTERGRI